ncbi:PI31 proteasome regulator N-terminal-domain-containing protein [Russula earlei]|uniref:PI31 proteasome regulator N-terminal-domain-containing protein n=1 Tax=Russula earlei TaxID=71964 RepID=A0ACC0UQ19_9AGAM|nr:PI31 proteasome regulator N-terminal-domain-containing protein [Russula earlei]
MAPDLLDPSALIAPLLNLLPRNKRRLESQQDAIVALIHSAFNALSFRLIAVDDSSPESTIPGSLLPEAWNINGPGNYTLRYRHEQSSLEFIIKVGKLGRRTLINAIAVESDKMETLDIATNDFTSPSFYPFDAEADNAPPLIHGYISSNRVADFVDQLKLKIIQNIMPGLHKEGYAEGSDPLQSSARPRRDFPANNPARPQPLPPPYAPERPFGEPSHVPSRNPLEIGRRDLDPLGFDPLSSFGPPPLFPGSGDRNGMFVGPNHPIFGQRGRGAFPPDRGPWGGDGFLPPMGAPPGARFDPVGPGLGPFPGGGSLGPRGGVPGGGNLREPDNDEFMPPGAVSFCVTIKAVRSTDDWIARRVICSCKRRMWKWVGCVY